jgi:two-component system response regulator LytT
LKTHPAPDLILADIELSDGQCFEIFKEVNLTCAVIFTTSYYEFAINAFQANSTDYLLKPIKLDDLKNSINKYHLVKQHYIDSLATHINKVENEIKSFEHSYIHKSFLVKQGQRYIPVNSDKIAYFYKENGISYIVTWTKQKLAIDFTLEEIEKKINAHYYYRINRTFIIHRNAVIRFKNLFNRKLRIDLAPLTPKEVIVSKEKATGFKKWMNS